jgi:hypothetical protein
MPLTAMLPSEPSIPPMVKPPMAMLPSAMPPLDMPPLDMPPLLSDGRFSSR